jgi:hypothetical protein
MGGCQSGAAYRKTVLLKQAKNMIVVDKYRNIEDKFKAKSQSKNY